MKRLFFLFCTLLINIAVYAQNVPNGATSVSGSYNQIPLPGPIVQMGNIPYSFLNFTRTAYARKPTTTPLSSLVNASDDYDVVTTFYTGWWKPIQTIERGKTVTKKDIVTPFITRPSLTQIDFKPYPDTNRSRFQTNPTLEQKDYYQSIFPNEAGTAANKVVFDNSLPSPTTYSYKAGKGNVGKSVGEKSWPTFNGYGDDIAIISIDDAGQLSPDGYYDENTLMVQNSEGQNNLQITAQQVFVDDRGLTICKKVYHDYQTHITYYVYDDLDRLRYIFPPKAVDALSTSGWNFSNAQGQTILNQLCYSYHYNEFGQIIEKKNPDRSGLEYFVYDKKQRPVLYQSPLLATSNQWQFTIYDSRDRVVMKGMCTSATATGTSNNYSRLDWQNAIDASTPTGTPSTLIEFLSSGFNGLYPASITGAEITQYNYYDSYTDFVNSGSIAGQPTHNYDYSYLPDYLSGGIAESPHPYDDVRGNLTATKTKILDINATGNYTNQWINTVYRYDFKDRLIQTATLNPWNATNWDIVTNQYDFLNRPVLNINSHFAWSGNTNPATKLKTKYIYEDDLLKYVHQSINNSAYRDISSMQYDDLGKLTTKHFGGINTQMYNYNIRDQLTGINAQYLNSFSQTIPPAYTFMELLSYDFGFTEPRFDGKISGIIWKTRSFPSASFSKAAYGYRYDATGRLISADFREQNTNTGNPAWTIYQKNYSVSNLEYDVNGNILSMVQKGPVSGNAGAIIDDLTYSYAPNSNKLVSVTDGGVNAPAVEDFKGPSVYVPPVYEYDENGNLKKDQFKGLDITYNHLDLPLGVTKNNDAIENIYDADGKLLTKFITEGGQTTEYRYWGPFVYKKNNTNTTTPWSIEYLLHEEGRCRYLADSGLFKYDYFIKDHLGNVRTTVTADEYSGVQEYLAGHEIASANLEGLMFSHLDDVRDVKPEGSGADEYAAMLNGEETERRIGTALLVKVMEGDKIKISTQGYYSENGDMNMHTAAEDMLGTLLTTLTGSSTGEGGEGETSYIVESLFNPNNYIDKYDAIKENQTNPELPRAYLNYLVFDPEFNLVPEASGVVQVGAVSDQWNLMDVPEFTVGTNGYVAIYLSNEQHMNVYFDLVSLVHYRGRMIDEQHYYPHGLMYHSVSSNTTPENKYKFEGKLLQDELGMQLYDFHARQYDPQLGRFWGVDPMDQFPSGYTGIGNDPANFTDPTGMVVEGMGPSGPSGGGDSRSIDFEYGPTQTLTIYYAYPGPETKGAPGNNTSGVKDKQDDEKKSSAKSVKMDEVVVKAHKTWFGKLWSKVSQKVHNALDVVGMLPGAGEAFDAINGLIYLAEGNGKMATVSFAATIPIFGNGVTALKWAGKGVSFLEKKGFKIIGAKWAVNYSRVLNSASSSYKGSTVLGHALSKHAGRNPNIWGKLAGNPSTWHDQALKHFNDIMNAAGDFNKTTTERGIRFLEKRLSDGRGIRLNMDGTFKGFID